MVKIGENVRSYHHYTEMDLKVLFGDKVQRESARFEPKKERVISQQIIPVERFDPVTGENKVVDVKIINYVITKDGKIHLVFEGEGSPKELEEEKDYTLSKTKEDSDKEKISKRENKSFPSLEREKAMTYVCSNGETNDGLVTKLTPTESFIHVSFHEQQHLVARNIEAFLNDEKIFLEYIRLYTRFDPTTGKIYVSGGRAVTVKGKVIHPQNLYPELLPHSQAHTYQVPS